METGFDIEKGFFQQEKYEVDDTLNLDEVNCGIKDRKKRSSERNQYIKSAEDKWKFPLCINLSCYPYVSERKLVNERLQEVERYNVGLQGGF